MEKYSIIYADPPWKYDREVGVAATHYNTMPIEEICNLPVREIADSNSLGGFNTKQLPLYGLS